MEIDKTRLLGLILNLETQLTSIRNEVMSVSEDFDENRKDGMMVILMQSLVEAQTKPNKTEEDGMIYLGRLQITLWAAEKFLGEQCSH